MENKSTKQLIEAANRKCEMRWRVLAFNPDEDNKLVKEFKDFDCIDCAVAKKREYLEKNPTHVVEIISESKAQRNEEVTKSNYKSIINELESIFKKFAGNGLELGHKIKPNSFDLPFDTSLSVALKDKAKLEPVKAALKKVIDKYGAKKVAHDNDFAYNFGKSNRDGIYVGFNWNATSAFVGYAVNPDFDVKALSESAQKNEAQGIQCIVKLKVKKSGMSTHYVPIEIIKDNTNFKPNFDPNELYKATPGFSYALAYHNPGNTKLNNLVNAWGSRYDWDYPKNESTQKNEALYKIAKTNKEKEEILAKIEKDPSLKLVSIDNVVSGWKDNKNGIPIAQYNTRITYKKESSQKNEALNLDKLTDADAKQLIMYLNDFIKDKASKYYYIDKIEAILKKRYKAESSQINETRGYKVIVELGAPDNMNNRDIEDEVERLLRSSRKIDVVIDVTAERS